MHWSVARYNFKGTGNEQRSVIRVGLNTHAQWTCKILVNNSELLEKKLRNLRDVILTLKLLRHR